MNGDADRQHQRAHCGDLRVSRKITGVDDAHGHPLRQIVQSDGQHQHRRSLKPAVWAFSLRAAPVQMGNNVVQGEKEQDAKPESDDGGDK